MKIIRSSEARIGGVATVEAVEKYAALEMIILNHIYPDGTRRELIRSTNLDELKEYALERLDDHNLISLFTELEWKAEGRELAPMTERLSSSLEIIIT